LEQENIQTFSAKFESQYLKVNHL